MKRPRIVFYAILAIVGLIVGVQAVFASADPPPPVGLTVISTPQANLTNHEWNISGTIQAMNGEFWTVQGFAIRVDATTRIIGDLPTIGSYVEAEGLAQSDGTWTATELRVGHDTLNPSPTATSVRTVTPTDTTIPQVVETSPISTAAATPRATAIRTATAMPTVVPAAPSAKPVGARPPSQNAVENQDHRLPTVDKSTNQDDHHHDPKRDSRSHSKGSPNRQHHNEHDHG